MALAPEHGHTLPAGAAARDAVTARIHAMNPRAGRSVCDYLGLFHLCIQTRCRRAQACRGDPRFCARAHLPLVPQPVRDFVGAVLDAHRDGESLEAAEDSAAEFADAFAGWSAALDAAASARRSARGARR